MPNEKIHLWEKVYAWWKKLPWWGKVLGCVALLGVALLFVAQFWTPSFGKEKLPTRADNAQVNNIETATESYELKQKRLAEELKAKKLVEIMLINQGKKIDKKAVETREKINNAKSIEEIDEILKNAR